MDKNQNNHSSVLTLVSVLCLSFLFGSCELVGDIFKAGMGFGIFIILAIAVAIVAIIIKMRKK